VKHSSFAAHLLIVMAALSFSQFAPAQAGSSSLTVSQNDSSEPATLPSPKFFYSTEYQSGKVGG
jgi:hypothetical protein